MQDEMTKSFMAFSRYICAEISDAHVIEKERDLAAERTKKARADKQKKEGVKPRITWFGTEKKEDYISLQDGGDGRGNKGTGFMGYLPPFSLKNEVKVWKYIEEVCIEAM